MIGRLPESWIPPDHILDLRARVRLRHTLSHQRGEWQQRIQAVLYHHGCPAAAQPDDRRGPRAGWRRSRCPPAAREQITVALSVIDALDVQLAPLDKELRAFARRQPGCKALMSQFGVGELTAVTILAELGDARRFSSSRDAVRYAGLDITVHQSDQRRAAGHSQPPGTAGAALGAVRSVDVRRPRRAAQTTSTTRRPPSGSDPTGRGCRSRASSSSAAITCCASSARRRWLPHDLARCAPGSSSPRCAAAGSTPAPAATSAWTALIDRAAATLPPAGSPHQPSCRRPGAVRVVDRDKAERPRAHDQHPRPRSRTATRPGRSPIKRPAPRLAARLLHR